MAHRVVEAFSSGQKRTLTQKKKIPSKHEDTDID